jgi:PRC-barrel domain
VLYAGLVALLLAPAVMAAHAQTAGTTTLGVSVAELSNVLNGWSVREQLLGEKIGKIEDIILTKDRLASYGIVSTGDFLGRSSHDFAIRAGQFQFNKERIMLPNATKDQLRATPPFQYARK